MSNSAEAEKPCFDRCFWTCPSHSPICWVPKTVSMFRGSQSSRGIISFISLSLQGLVNNAGIDWFMPWPLKLCMQLLSHFFVSGSYRTTLTVRVRAQSLSRIRSLDPREYSSPGSSMGFSGRTAILTGTTICYPFFQTLNFGPVDSMVTNHIC